MLRLAAHSVGLDFEFDTTAAPTTADLPAGSVGRGGQHLIADRAAAAREFVEVRRRAEKLDPSPGSNGVFGQVGQSTMLRSIETRPTSGQRRPATADFGARLLMLIAPAPRGRPSA